MVFVTQCTRVCVCVCVHVRVCVFAPTVMLPYVHAASVCANLVDPDNGRVVSLTDQTNPGSVALYSCTFGYRLTGIQGTTRTCMPTGEWDGRDPTCKGG